MDDTQIDQLIAPAAPHDDLSFDELARSYNYRNVSSRTRLLVRLLLKELAGRERPIRALDIGCGEGISTGPDAVGYLRAIHREVDELWGVEPDESINPEHCLFTNFQHALLEDAELPKNYFDLAYSYMVIEHITEPKAFFDAVYRCLKTGGVFIGLTVNRGHHFTQLASLANRMKVDEVLLRLLRGRELVEGYHYPTTYKCNSPKQLREIASTSGFAEPGFVFTENAEASVYLKGPLKPIGWLSAGRRRRLPESGILINLFVRLEKPDTLTPRPSDAEEAAPFQASSSP